MDLRSAKTIILEVTTAEQLISIFDGHPMFRAPGGIEARATGTNRFIFRGQSDSCWPLLPSSLRWTENELEYVRTLDSNNTVLYLKEHLLEELFAVKDFLLLASSLGFQVPITPEHLFEYIIPIETKTLTGKVPELPPLSADVLDGMALAQHHGVKTRLMDWTESAYTAAFFAAYSSSLVNEFRPSNLPDWMVVHCLNQARLGSYPRVRSFIPQRHGKDFMRAQRGMFVIFKDVSDRFVETRTWPSLQELFEADDPIPYVNEWPLLVSFHLPVTEADAMLRILYNRGISRATLMPNLDNIATDRLYVQKLFGD